MRIEQNHTFLTTQIQQAMSGNLGIVQFQRDYAWFEEDVEALFRSLLKEWPIGSFMTWEPHDDVDRFDIQRGSLGPIQTAFECRRFLLDGQNRLGSFAWAYGVDNVNRNDVTRREREVWLSGRTLAADFEKKAIFFVEASEAYDGERLPLGDIIKAGLSSDRKDWFKIADALDKRVSAEAFDWLLEEVPLLIRTARVTEVCLKEATIEEAKEAFLGICRAGQPISPEEFDRAMEWQPYEPRRP